MFPSGTQKCCSGAHKRCSRAPTNAFLELAGDALELKGAVLDRTGLALKPTGAVLERTGVVLEPTGAVLERTRAVLEPTGAALEPTCVRCPSASALVPWRTRGRSRDTCENKKGDLADFYMTLDKNICLFSWSIIDQSFC